MGRRNELNWDCRANGCYLWSKKPKLEDLAENLHGNCSFTDIDGMTERNWNFLMVEWKTLGDGEEPSDRTIPTGQALAYKRASEAGKFLTVCLAGNPTVSPMRVTHWGWWVDGAWTGWSRTDLAEVNAAIGSWSGWAAEHYGWDSRRVLAGLSEIRSRTVSRVRELANQIEELVERLRGG